MSSPVFLSIIIPLFNEERSVPILFEQLDRVLSGLEFSREIIVVNDGSSDGTEPALDREASGRTNVKIIHLTRNFGQTAALSAGFQEAAGEILVTMDGDLQNDPADIPLLLEKIREGYDVVSGWRKNRKDLLVSRRLTSMVANKMVSWVGGLNLKDYGCTLKAYRAEILKGVKLYGEMHRFIPLFVHWNGARVTEVPVRHHKRRFGKSKYGLSRVVKVLLDLAFIKFMLDYGVKPIRIFGGFGIFNFLGALLTGSWAVCLDIFGDKPFLETYLPVLTVAFFLVGALSLLMGFLAELMVRIYHESGGRSTFAVRKKP